MSIALESLHRTRELLLLAHMSAGNAETNLAGARHRRASELVEKIEDCIAHVERLHFCVLGDQRAGQ